MAKPWQGLLLRGSWGVGGSNAPPPPRDALEGRGPQRRPKERLDRRLQGVAKAVGGGSCRLQMPLGPAIPFMVSEGNHQKMVGAARESLQERGGGGAGPQKCEHQK